MKNGRLLIAILAMTAVNVAVAHARTIYVAPIGEDGNSGALESPLRTIQKVAEVARAGDTVLVRTGVHRGLVLLRFTGEPDKLVIFKNAPAKANALIDTVVITKIN